jgi:hypothetical protein
MPSRINRLCIEAKPGMDWTLHPIPLTKSSLEWLKEFSGTNPPPMDTLPNGWIYADRDYVIRNNTIYILPSGPECIEKPHFRRA